MFFIVIIIVAAAIQSNAREREKREKQEKVAYCYILDEFLLLAFVLSRTLEQDLVFLDFNHIEEPHRLHIFIADLYRIES